jgi:hypothetical protein
LFCLVSTSASIADQSHCQIQRPNIWMASFSMKPASLLPSLKLEGGSLGCVFKFLWLEPDCSQVPTLHPIQSSRLPCLSQQFVVLKHSLFHNHAVPPSLQEAYACFAWCRRQLLLLTHHIVKFKGQTFGWLLFP